MIRGGFSRQRPHVSGLVVFPDLLGRRVSSRFLVDTGADRSLLAPADYELDGFSYREFSSYPAADSIGYGGGIVGKIVPAKLLLRHENGIYQQVGLDIEIIRGVSRTEGLPSILGRDVTDLFRLTVDRSVNLVELSDAADAGALGDWPDEAPER